MTAVAGWPAGASRAYRLGRILVDPPVAMAPMADVTDPVFHEVLREIGGPGLYTAEMVSSDALLAGSEEHLRLVRRPAGCPVFAVQVYGSEPGALAEAARLAVDDGADVVDINMGCPAKTLTGKACGSALLRDLPLVRDVLRAVRRAVPEAVPVTVKTRLGWDDRHRVHVEVGRIAEGEGLAGIALHGRTRAQMFSGRSDRGAIAELARAVSIPVVGNGDVRTADDAVQLLEETGCAGVMIARGALANPWIFRQLRARLHGEPVAEPSLADRRRVILDHHARLAGELPAERALHRMRKFLGLYLHGVPSGQDLRRRIGTMRDERSFREAVDAFFDGLAAAA